MLFENLDINKPILRAIKEEGYIKPTPIQEEAIPYLLKGKDLLGCAQTGTGKTAAFAIPILQNISDRKTKTKVPGWGEVVVKPSNKLGHLPLLGGGMIEFAARIVRREKEAG